MEKKVTLKYCKIFHFLFNILMKSYTQDGYQIIIPQKIGDYDVIDIIGCGSTCVVALVQNQKTKEKFSSKIMSKKNIKERNLLPIIQNEIEILQSLNHPNIIKIHETFELKNENDEELFIIITEYCENGDLLSFCLQKKFKNEIEKKKIIFKFLSAIQYLHNKGISHGDIKGDNILLDKHLNPKLCDFGYARKTIIAGDESKNGTIYYTAPELYAPGKFNTLNTDIYSIGILLYVINELHFPFIDGNTEAIISQIVSGKLNLRQGIDNRLKQIVTKCTFKDPYERPTIEEVIKDNYFAEIIHLYLIKQNKLTPIIMKFNAFFL